MSDELNKFVGLEKPLSEIKRAKENPLGFSLEFRESTALVALKDRRLAQDVLLRRLVLEVPDVRFPFDVEGGAEQFRHHRCRLRTLDVSLSEKAAQGIISKLLDPVRYGIENVVLSFQEGHGLLTGLWRLGEKQAFLSIYFMAEGMENLGVRIGLTDIRVYGYIPMPVSALAAQLGRALKPLGIKIGETGYLEFAPVRALMRWLLPSHGWKIPDLEGLRLSRVVMNEGEVRLLVARYPDEGVEDEALSRIDEELSIYEHQFILFKEGLDAYGKAEQALSAGKLEEARKQYLGKGGIEPLHPHASRRMLEIGLTNPDYFDELEDLVKDLLAKDDRFLPAWFAKAVMQENQEDREAGRTYEKIGQLSIERGERKDAILAYLKAGALQRKLGLDQAVPDFEKVLELDPDHAIAMRTLGELYEEQKQWYRALRMYLRLVRRLDSDHEMSSFHVRMGKIMLDHLDDPEGARKHFNTALMHKPDNLEALDAQAEMSEARGQYNRAAKLLLRRMELLDPEKQSEELLQTRLRLARLREAHLDDPGNALFYYEQILKSHPDHMEALERVGSIYVAQENWDQASAIFSRLLDMEAAGKKLDDRLIKSACFALGRIGTLRKEGSQAARQYFKRAAELDENDIAAWLELEIIDREEQAWPELVEDLEHKSQLLEDPEKILAVALEAARISDRQLRDLRKAEQLYGKALEIQPMSPEAVEGLSLIMAEEGRFDELVEMLTLAASIDEDGKRAIKRWIELSKVYVEKLDDLEAGTWAVQQAVEINPRNKTNVEILLSLFRQQKRYQELVDLISSQSSNEWEVADLAELYLEQALVLDQLGQTEESITVYRRVLEIRPGDLNAYRALVDLYLLREEWNLADQIIPELLDRARDGELSESENIDLRRKAASVRFSLGKPGAAIEQYEAILEKVEDDAESISWLQRLLAEQDRWEDLAELQARLAQRQVGEKRAELYNEAASIWQEKLDGCEPAMVYYQKALKTSAPGEQTSSCLYSLQKVLVKLGRWREVAEVLQERIALSESQDQIKLIMFLAAVQNVRMHDTDSALESWERVLQIDPGCLSALILLSRHSSRQGRLEKALEYGKLALEHGETHPRFSLHTQARLALLAAEAAWDLEEWEDAVALYSMHFEGLEQVQYTGVQPETLDRLIQLLGQQEKHDQIADVYSRWLTAGILPDRHGEVRRSLAGLLFEHLQQPEQALELLSQQVSENPDDQDAVSDLIKILHELKQWDRLAELLEQQWDDATNEKRRIERLEKLAVVYQEHLSDSERTIWAWKMLVELNHESATERLMAIYRQEGRYQDLAELLLNCAETIQSPKEARSFWLERAEVCLSRLGDREEALRSFRHSLKIEVDDEVVLRLASLYQEDENWPAVRKMQEHFVKLATDPAEIAKRLVRLGQILYQHLNKTKKAVKAFERALEMNPEWLQPLHELAEIYGKEQQWRELLDVKLRLSQAESQGEIRAEHLVQIARLAFDKLEEPSRGIELLWEAASESPDPMPIWEELADRGEQAEIYEQSAQAIERMLEPVGGITDLTKSPAGLYRRLAGLREKTSQPQEAIDAYRQSLSLEPTDPTSAERLMSIYRAENRLNEIAMLKQDLADRQSGHPAADAWMSCAESWLEAENQPAVIEALKQALSADPGHEKSMELMLQILVGNQDWETMLDLLTRIPEALFENETIRNHVESGTKQIIESRIAPQMEIAACRVFLRINPKHMLTWLRLSALLQEHAEAAEYESALRSIDDNAELLDDDQRYELDMVLARIDFSRGQLQVTEERLRRCVSVKSEEDEPRAFLHKLLSGSDRTDDEIELLLEEADKAASFAQRTEKLFRVAELKELELGDPAGAAELIEKLTEQGPDLMEAWNRLEELYRLIDDPEKQHQALLQVARLSLGESTGQALRKAATIAHERLEDLDTARKTWIDLLELIPDDEEALDRLSDLDRKQGQYEQLEQRLQIRASVAKQPDQQVSLLRERVEILLEKLQLPERAIEGLEQLERLLPDEISVLQQLGVLYEQQNLADKLVGNLQQRLRLAGSESVRATLWSKLANVKEKLLDDIDGAKQALRQAVIHESDNPIPLLQRLYRLASQSDDGALIIEVLEALSQRCEDKEQRHAYIRSIGLYRWSAGLVQEAKRAFLQAMELDPEDAVSRRFLVDVLYPEEPQASIKHIKWLLDHPNVLNPQDQYDLHKKLAKALEQSDPAEQMEELERLLELYPNDLTTAQTLVKLYQRAGRQKAYADLLVRICDMEGVDAAPACWVERGDILVGQEQINEAVSAYKRALELEGDHRYQVVRRLVKLQLMKLHDERAACETLEIGLQIQPDDINILRQLVDLYGSLEEWERAGQMIHQLKDLPGQERDINLLFRAGEIDTRRNRIDDALHSYLKVLKLDPDSLSAYQMAEKILVIQKAEDDLADLYLSWARSPAAGDRKSALYKAALKSFDDRLDAVFVDDIFNEWLDLEPPDLEAFAFQVERLKRLERWSELVKTQERYIGLVEDSDLKAELFFEMGTIFGDRLQDLAAAAAAFMSCLLIAPGHVGAVEALATIHPQKEQETDRTEDFATQPDERDIDAEGCIAAFRMGEAAKASGEEQQAALYFQQAVEHNPSFVPAYIDLIAILENNHAYDQIVANLEKLLQLSAISDNTEIELDLLLLMGRTKRHMLRFDESAKWYQMVLEKGPNQIEALRVLKEMAINQGHFEDAIRYARSEIENTPQMEAKTVLWAALGDIYQEGLHNTDEALNAYKESLRLDPAQFELQWKLWELEDIDVPDESMIQKGEQMLTGLLDDAAKGNVHRSLGQAYLLQGTREKALEHFEQSLMIAGGDLQFIDQVTELARSAQNWPLWACLFGQALELRIQTGLAPEEAAEMYMKLAGVYREHMEDMERATAAIQRSLELKPKDLKLMRQLGTLYASNFETYRQAIGVFRELAVMEPTEPKFYRYLARLEAARGEMDRAACYYIGLRLLLPEDQEASKYIDYVGTTRQTERALTPKEWDKIFLHPKADCLMQKIVSAMAPYLEQLFPADQKSRGLAEETFITDQNYPQVAEAADIAKRIVDGVREVDLYRISGDNDVYKVRLDTGNTPSILFSSGITDHSAKQELIFLVVSEVIKVSMGFALPSKLGGADFVKLIGMLCKLADPEIDIEIELPKTTSQYLAAIQQLTPKDIWEKVRPFICSYALDPQTHDMESWFEGVQLTADRVALLACGNLEASMSVMVRNKLSTSLSEYTETAERVRLIEDYPRMMSLFRFAFSEPFLQARAQMGTIVEGP